MLLSRPHLFVAASILWSAQCLAQDQTQISADEWRKRIKEAKQKVGQLRSEGRLSEGVASDGPAQLRDDEAEKMALDDSQLQPGDLVVTRKGRLKFMGYSGETRIFVLEP